jgi:hypothetical protein
VLVGWVVGAPAVECPLMWMPAPTTVCRLCTRCITCTAHHHFCNHCVTLRHDNIIEVQRVFLNNLNHEVSPIPFIASLA